jgi:hypothetical protein
MKTVAIIQARVGSCEGDNFHLSDVVDLLEREPEIIKPNQHLVEGQYYRAVLEE